MRLRFRGLALVAQACHLLASTVHRLERMAAEFSQELGWTRVYVAVPVALNIPTLLTRSK